MFRTLHSNSTIYLSTRLPSGDVRVHTEVSRPLTVGVGRVTGRHTYVNNVIKYSYMYDVRFDHILSVPLIYIILNFEQGGYTRNYDT